MIEFVFSIDLPRNDLADNSKWLAESVCEFLGGGLNRLTKAFISPAAVVSEGSNGIGEIVLHSQLIGLAFVSKYVRIGNPFGMYGIPVIPLSHASMLAKSSFFSSINSERRTNSRPRSVAGSFFHEGALKAALAARTAVSTSSALAASTVAISFSVLDAISRPPSKQQSSR